MPGGEGSVRQLLMCQHPCFTAHMTEAAHSAGIFFTANEEAGSWNLGRTTVAPFQIRFCSKQALAGGCGCRAATGIQYLWWHLARAL